MKYKVVFIGVTVTATFPAPVATKQAQIIPPPPTCFTVGKKFTVIRNGSFLPNVAVHDGQTSPWSH